MVIQPEALLLRILVRNDKPQRPLKMTRMTTSKSHVHLLLVEEEESHCVDKTFYSIFLYIILFYIYSID